MSRFGIWGLGYTDSGFRSRVMVGVSCLGFGDSCCGFWD